VPVRGEISTHRLAGPGPHDPARLLAFVGAHAVAGLESWDGETYGRVLDLPGGPALAAVTADDGGYQLTLRLPQVADPPDPADPADSPDPPDPPDPADPADPDDPADPADPADAVHATAPADPAAPRPAATRAAAIRLVRGLLAVEQDVTVAQRLLAADPLLGPLVAARPGLRLPGSVDHAETLVRTVMGQQVSLAGGRAAAARLVAAHGEPLPAAWQGLVPGLTAGWPRAAVLAALDPTDPALAMPAARARTVVAAAAAVIAAGGRLPPPAQLLAVPGIGPWTSDYVDLRCRAARDVFLPGDLGVRRALERLGVPAAPREAADLATRWAPYRSLALAHLWAAYLDL
jgi:3-methyladenine DNA glycosylase/8-oxoguanine DNA glycosylase